MRTDPAEMSDQPSQSGGRKDFFSTGPVDVAAAGVAALTAANGCPVLSAKSWVNSGVSVIVLIMRN